MNATVAVLTPEQLLAPALAPAVSKSLSRIVLTLLFAQLWLSQSTLSIAQIGVEILLGATLLAMLRNCRLQRYETGLVLLFAASVCVSLGVNPLPVTLVFAKVFGLSILSLLTFARYRFETRDALWVIGCNVLLTLYQYVFGNPSWFLAIVLSVGETWRDFAASRPLGLFMSTHASAVLTALMFLWLGRSKLSVGLGLVTLVLSGSTNVTLAYIGQIAQRVLRRLGIEKLALAAGLIAVLAAIVYARTVLDLDFTAVSNIVGGREQVSYSIIVSQLFSPEYYSRAFTLIPGDPIVLYNEASGDWPNEIGYLATLQQGGFILGIGYIALLLYRIRGFRVFMVIGMLHFSMQTIPIVLFLLLQWSETLSPPRRNTGLLVFLPREAR